MENQFPISLLIDESSTSNTPERSPHSIYSRDSTQEDHQVPHHYQNEYLRFIKDEDESEESDVSDNEECMEEDTSLEVCKDSGDTTVAETNLKIEEEEEVICVNIKEEELLTEVSIEGQHPRNNQEISTFISADGEKENSVGGHLITFNFHPPVHSADHSSDFSTETEYFPYQSQPNTLRNPTEPMRWNCFTESGEVILHKNSHTLQTPYFCPECGKSFSQKSSVKRHMLLHKRNDTEEKTHRCSECGEEFLLKYQLLKHKKVHKGESLPSCSECGKSFACKSHLVKHQRIHTAIKPYSCFTCGKSFFEKLSLLFHERVHTREKPTSGSEPENNLTTSESTQSSKVQGVIFSCSVCGKLLTNKSSLSRHEKSHTGEKPYSCSECGRSFALKSNLNVHKLIHTGEKPFFCSECGKTFARKSTLIRHQISHTIKM